MTETPIRLAVIIAGTRSGRFGGTIGRWFVTQVQQHEDLWWARALNTARAAQPYPA